MSACTIVKARDGEVACGSEQVESYEELLDGIEEEDETIASIKSQMKEMVDRSHGTIRSDDKIESRDDEFERLWSDLEDSMWHRARLEGMKDVVDDWAYNASGKTLDLQKDWDRIVRVEY